MDPAEPCEAALGVQQLAACPAVALRKHLHAPLELDVRIERADGPLERPEHVDVCRLDRLKDGHRHDLLMRVGPDRKPNLQARIVWHGNSPGRGVRPAACAASFPEVAGRGMAGPPAAGPRSTVRGF